MEDNIKTRYFPALCATCARCFLAAMPLKGGARSQALCSKCGGAGKLLPGALYTEADRKRFERLEVAFHSAHLTREQAATLAAMLERAARDDARRRGAIDEAMSKTPQLQAARQLIPYATVELHQFLGIAIVLLSCTAQAAPQPRIAANPSTLPMSSGSTHSPTGNAS